MTILVSSPFNGGVIAQLDTVESYGRVEAVGAGHAGVAGRLYVEGSELVASIESGDPLTNTGTRSEVRYTADPYSVVRWHAWETCIPAALGSGQYVVMQLHDTPDGGEGAVKAPNFLVSAWDGNFVVQVPLTVASEQAASRVIAVVPYTVGQWYRFGLQIKHTPTAGQGLMRLMLDRQVIANTGLDATSYSDTVGPYLKLGIYRYGSGVFSGRPTVRHRNLVIADGLESDQAILGGVPGPYAMWGVQR